MGVKRRLPPTEQVHPRSLTLHSLPTLTIIERLHREDRVAVNSVKPLLKSIARAADVIASALATGGRLIYVGAGTSGRLAALDAAECPPTFGTPPGLVSAVVAGGERALLHAVEGAEDNRAAAARAMRRLKLTGHDVVCGVSASARTPFVLEALKSARAAGCHTLLVCCNPDATRAPVADLVLAAATGAELVAGSTRLKAGTATKLILNALSTAAMVRLGRVYAGRMVDLKPTNRKLKARAQRIRAELSTRRRPKS